MKILELTKNAYAKITGTNRYTPEPEWGRHSVIYNGFRVFEQVFGRKIDPKKGSIRREVTQTISADGKRIVEYHTIEAALVGLECAFWDSFNFMLPKFKLVKVYIPVLAPVGGYRGLSGSPYVFAIARDSTLGEQDTGTFAFNNVAGNFLVFSIRTASGETVTSVTYNLVSLSNSVQRTFDPGDRIIYLWTLKSPATGSNNIVIVGPTVFRDQATTSYSGCDTTTNPDGTGSNGSAGPVTSITASVTSNSTGDWAAAVARSDTGTLTTGTNWVPYGATSIDYGDSNGTVGATGSISVTANGPSGAMYIAALTIKPAASAGPANLKSLDGNVKANIKSFDGNLLANIKSINTNA